MIAFTYSIMVAYTLMNLTIKQIRYFITAIETGSLRRAAEKLGVSQPTISEQIAALEKALELNLLERSRSGSLPTAIGRTLLPLMQQLMRSHQDILTLAQDASKTPAGTHKLGVPYTLGPYLLPDVIPEIHRSFPALRFFVKEDTPRNLEQGLLEGTYDLILTPLPLDIPTLAHEPIFTESLFLVAPPDHTLAQKRKIMPDDFINENFLVIEERHRFFVHIQQLAKEYGFNLLRDFEGTSLDTLRQMIGTGMGISFFPALYVRSEISPREDVITLDLGFSLPQRNIAIAWRSTSLQKHIYLQICRIIRNCCREKLSGYVEVLEKSP